MKTGRKLLIILLSAVLSIGAIAGIAVAVRSTTGSAVLVVQAANFNYGGGWYSGQDSVSGVMTTNAEQTIYLMDTEEVAEVLVHEGQAVRAGDILFTYDTKRTGMNLEREKISRERILLDIDVCERNIKTLASISPVSDGGFGIPGDFGFFDPGDGAADYASMPHYDTLDDKSEPRNAPGAGVEPEQMAGILGTEDSPYIFLASGEEVTLTEAFIEKWQKTAKDAELAQLFVAIELRSEDGTLQKAWIQDIMQLDPKTAITLDMATGETSYAKMDDPEKLAALLADKEPEVLAQVLQKLDPDDLTTAAGLLDERTLAAVLSRLSGDRLTTVMGSLSAEQQREILRFLQEEERRRQEEEESGQGGQEGGGQSGQEGGQQGGGEGGSQEGGQGGQEGGGQGGQEGGQQGGGEGGSQEGGQGGSEGGGQEGGQGGSEEGSSQEGGQDGNEGGQQGSQGGSEEGAGQEDGQSGSDEGAGQEEGGSAQLPEGQTGKSVLLKARVSTVRRLNLGGIGAASGGVNLIDPDAVYTSEELEKAKKEEQKRLASLKLDLRESDLKIARAQRAVDEGSARASMNGVIKTVGDPKNPPTDGTPFLRLTSAEGLFVRSAVRENMLGSMHEGDIVTVRSWQNGMSYEAEVRDISPYPDETGMFSWGSTESFYPFTAYISDTNAELQNDEWVEVSFQAPPEDLGEAASLFGDGGPGEIDLDSIETEEAIDFAGVSESDVFYLWKAFIREENGSFYVYKENERGRLQKQTIEVGSISGESYEVLSGLTGADWIAFPYGKNVKEGARVREGTPDELYN